MEVLLGLGRVSGLFGFLVASTIFAAIGTAVRGLLRPISWALLALALVLMISNRLAAGANNQIPSPDSPVAQEGWQDVARELELVYSDTLTDPSNPVPSPGSNRRGSNRGGNNTVSPGDGSTAAPERAASPRQPSSPVPGLW